MAGSPRKRARRLAAEIAELDRRRIIAVQDEDRDLEQSLITEIEDLQNQLAESTEAAIASEVEARLAGIPAPAAPDPFDGKPPTLSSMAMIHRELARLYAMQVRFAEDPSHTPASRVAAAREAQKLLVAVCELANSGLEDRVKSSKKKSDAAMTLTDILARLAGDDDTTA